MSKILITGAAGFIGFQLVTSLTQGKDEIIGLDNLLNNHDYTIKLKRLAQFKISEETLNADLVARSENLTFVKIDLLDKQKLEDLFEQNKFDLVIHLAAQTGVRHSVLYPQQYIDNNITAFNNLLECCRNHGVFKLIYASSSSVYGMNNKMPYHESDSTDFPVSIYAVTKKANELLAANYTWQNKMSCIGLRFFTVYGPWCRTDMAAYIFMKAITEGNEINLFNDGDMLRDFTYVDDINTSIILVKQKILSGDFLQPFHEIYNVGNRNPATLFEYLSIIEKEIGKKAIIKNKPLQLGEVKATYADVQKLEDFIGFKPGTDLKYGVKEMVDWFKIYYSSLKK
jgi:UDP-glucuronate 4-epimerase